MTNCVCWYLEKARAKDDDEDEDDWGQRKEGAIHRSLSLETRVTLTDIADR